MSSVCRMVAFCSGEFHEKKHVFEERLSCAPASELRAMAQIKLGCNFCLEKELDGKGLCRWLKVHYAPVKRVVRG
ncbi:hypothetical protein [Cloacibacillus porcorum]|uniref:hypothetical protein n=1 Tax=Cloacibacillus porcorum TaxID=1197717 RepID=UPI00258BDFDD|nr:hypothetical protein [Cloacibacillus porcorum]